MKTLLHLCLLFVTIASFSQNQPKDRNHLQTFGHVVKTSFNTIPSDFVYLGKEFSDDWAKTGYYAAGILGLIATDKITTKFWQDNVEKTIDYRLPNITPHFLRDSKNEWIKGVNAYLTYPVIGVYIGSLIANNEKGQYVGVNAFKAIAYSTLITQVTLKTVFGRNRPDEPLNSGISPQPEFPNGGFTNNNWDFFNGRDKYILSHPRGSAFPSMHVTTYFALAKVLQMEYDNYWVPYSLMTVVFFTNVGAHNHWISDMVLGGVVGTLIGRSIVRSSWRARGILEKNKNQRLTLNYIPQFSSEFTGLRIVGNF
ncbi:phosphatase PAP2 family protein [Polaribacter sp. BAL334]|uniref:phosphatase PAP2 family protein n=1 Tax=Polaribacter sp. BAL334 TaxID=1708178 RepID=UPI0018D24DB3|nr:phosphatase PAP2 family protein [Polaribacter sp. BAL334]MBG7611711.1 phosphatase PAP2 family protein [Polaribacter sp. BAL334]